MHTFDVSFLPDALCNFVVLADTHYMIDPGSKVLEFESRRQQSARAAVAWRMIAAMRPDFIIHLGDLVQEYPGTPHFSQAMDEALGQMRQSGVGVVHQVAGNHDVGDKADSSMPTHPVTVASLEAYHRRCGPSWYSWVRDELHFIVLNSQIMNTSLTAATTQRTWLENDLAEHADKRHFVFMHLPPYLHTEDEIAVGHYDNLGQPDRAWLLALFEQYQVECLCTGHAHFAFYDRRGSMCYRVVPSTAFTRPGFGHLFTSGAPPESGRDDIDKLGFQLFRVYADRCDMHFIRTGAKANCPTRPGAWLVGQLSAAITAEKLGVTLIHPLANFTQVPLAWPSVVRQPVRNDYPLLLCLELGIARVRVPWNDIVDIQQGRRLRLLRCEGVALQVMVLWSEAVDLAKLIAKYGDQVDTWEIQIPGGLLPAAATLAPWKNEGKGDLVLAPILPGEQVKGKQHPRTRIGYLVTELVEVDTYLKCQALTGVRAVCYLDPDRPPLETVQQIKALAALKQLVGLDLRLCLPGADEWQDAGYAAEALIASCTLENTRLFVEPLIDLDRTMDVGYGLVDTLCNPRLVFTVLRCLNTILSRYKDLGVLTLCQENKAGRLLSCCATKHEICLVLPNRSDEIDIACLAWPLEQTIQCYALASGMSTVITVGILAELPIKEPTLLVRNI